MSGGAATPADPTTQSRDLPLDSHLHTNLSPDSNVPIDVYAAQAIEQEIGRAHV